MDQVIQSSQRPIPLPLGDFPFFYYYETRILNQGEEGCIGVGMAPTGYASGQPGWYHG